MKNYMDKSTKDLTNLRKAPSRLNHTRQVRIHVKKSSMVSTICQALQIAVLIAGLKTVAQDVPQSREIRVGDRAPLFTLKDQNDREVSLDTMIKKGPVAVV